MISSFIGGKPPFVAVVSVRLPLVWFGGGLSFSPGCLSLADLVRVSAYDTGARLRLDRLTPT